jgi:hypothetical protein
VGRGGIYGDEEVGNGPWFVVDFASLHGLVNQTLGRKCCTRISCSSDVSFDLFCIFMGVVVRYVAWYVSHYLMRQEGAHHSRA